MSKNLEAELISSLKEKFIKIEEGKYLEVINATLQKTGVISVNGILYSPKGKVEGRVEDFLLNKNYDIYLSSEVSWNTPQLPLIYSSN